MIFSPFGRIWPYFIIVLKPVPALLLKARHLSDIYFDTDAFYGTGCFPSLSSESVISFTLFFPPPPQLLHLKFGNLFRNVGQGLQSILCFFNRALLPILSLGRDLKIRLILNQLGFLKKTTNSVTTMMNLIFITVQYTSLF